MKCQNCGSTSGFRGESKVHRRKRSDGQMEMIAEPEIIYCKKCGEEVKPEKVDEKDISVISGVPKHLQGEFNRDDGENESE